MRCILTRDVLVAGTLLCSLFAASFAVGADEAKVADETKTDAAAGTQIVASNEPAKNQKPASPSWLNQRGTITTDQVIQELGISVTPEQRTQIEKAVRKRNMALQEANADFSKTLSKTLATSDSELDKRVTEQRERRRLDAIRSRQPGRYNGMKK
jgi:hypothetical protein